MVDHLTENRRIIAIGDIHGCFYTLYRLLEKLEILESDQLVFLGDYIDRGKYSKEVIDFFMKLRKCYDCHFLMGNHELMLLEYLSSEDPSLWLQNGGDRTLDSYESTDGKDIPDDHIAFFGSCNYYLETENYLFVHGGLDPELSVKENLQQVERKAFCWIRNHMRARHLEAGDYPKWEKTVVCGHTPTTEPVVLDKLISIDTGCVYHNDPSLGKLSAIVLPDRTIFQAENIDS